MVVLVWASNVFEGGPLFAIRGQFPIVVIWDDLFSSLNSISSIIKNGKSCGKEKKKGTFKNQGE